MDVSQQTALIVGGGPGISASCSRLFTENGMQVAVAARTPDKPELQKLAAETGAHMYPCDASKSGDVDALFERVEQDLGTPSLVIHNIDGRFAEIFRKPIAEAEVEHVERVLQNSAMSAFHVAQATAKSMLKRELPDSGQRGTMIFTNASGAMKGFPLSAAFAMACHAKKGLAQSMARELMPQGIHVAHVPIDAAIGWTQEDGSRAHRLAGTSVDDNLADPDRIADVYFQLHKQHRSTWAFEVILRPWTENW